MFLTVMYVSRVFSNLGTNKQAMKFQFLLLRVPFWIFGFSLVLAIENHPLVSSHASPPSLTITASMAAFSPGIQLPMEMKEEHRHTELNKKLVVLLIVACSILAIIFILSSFYCCAYYYWKLCQKKKDGHGPDVEKGISIAPFLRKFSSLKMVNSRGSWGSVSLIDYNILEKATHNFGDERLLGRGAFGLVYKATLEDDSVVAVKKLDCATEDPLKEFENEVNLLSKMQHPNIVSLMGYCLHDDKGFIVYELMPNGSLEDLLHGPSHGSSLTWHMRLKIALDTARGLEYLHEFCKPAVIHRDLKSSNILLDAKFNAKLSDFGLAVAYSSQNRNKLKLSGTVGYVAPEYMLDGELTDKSDVYAFGIVLLELLLGRRPVEKLASAHCQSIVTWAMPQLTNRSLLPTIVDPVIKDTVDEKYLFQVAAVAVLCVQPEPSYRPLITDIVHSLIPLVPIELGGTTRQTQAATNGGY